MPMYNNPFGFQAIGISTSGRHAQMTIRRTKLASNADAFFRGDALAPLAAGGVGRTLTPGTTPVIAVSDGYYAANNAADVRVASIPVDAGALFKVMSNGDFQRTQVGLNANLALGTGNATTQLSGDVLNTSTVATTNTLDLKIQENSADFENAYGNYGIAIVSFNRPSHGALVVGV